MRIVLEFDESPHTSSRQAITMFDVSHSSIIRALKPYKMIQPQKFMEDDFHRRRYFSEQIMEMLDNHVIQLEHVLFLL